VAQRVLIVSSFPPRHCGIGAYAATQAAALRGAGADVIVLSPPDGAGDVRVDFLASGAVFREAARRGEAADRIVVHFQPALYYRPGARAMFQKVRTSAALLSLVRRRPQTEILVHEANPPVRWRPDYVLLRRVFARAQLLFHTDAERIALQRVYGLGRVRARLVDHTEGVTVHGAVGRDEARRRLGLPSDEPVFVCAGFLHRDKGYDRAVKAFAAAGSPGRLDLVGSVRDATPANEAYAAELGDLTAATPGVSLHEDFVSDEEFDRWIAAADAVVLPYRRSWSSGALARAHAIGTPALVSDAGGLPEQAGPDDRVFETDDELAALFRELAKDRAVPAEAGS
jgi:glycosyltransferase involved in cell wall biosynthesis